ncbi:unnamed protein product [Symbiodinium microadriaticum]|nr:unnamed protein product [Symbiodinium microadriaticum]
MVDPLMQKQLRSKKKAMKVSGKAKGKQPAGADAASSKKDLRNRKQGCPAVVVPQCAEHVVVVLQKKESLQMGKIFKGKPKRAPATAVTVHVLCLDTSMSFAHASQIHAVRECTRGRSVLLLCS